MRLLRSTRIPLLVAALAVVILAAPASGQAYEETGKQHTWFSWSRPAEKSPVGQLAHATKLLKDSQLRKAGKAFRALVVTWPGSPEAPYAQWAYARVLDQQGKATEAFDEYQKLMDTYPGQFPDYEKVLARQFAIAKDIMNKRRGGFFFGGFLAPERAIPFFEKVISNAPRAAHAAEAQYLIGMAHEKSMEYELAVVAYIATLHRYPESPFAEPASLGRARSLYLMATDSPNDLRALEEAWAGVMVFLRSYPRSDLAPEAETMRDDLLQRMAKNAYEKARYYDVIATKPGVARDSYALFIEQFPKSPWTELARERLRELEEPGAQPKDASDHE